MPRYVTVHGHFYQPPRENPWLEAVQAEPSAQPYHDWNERVTAECYQQNAASRILDGSRTSIVDIVNNYARISFDFGPTLLAWLAEHAPEVYAAVLDADADSQARFSGHGSAMAQGYNHLIMPLANPRDRVTQVRWGIADFRSRFGREPEGMWLPETAVDVETLETLAAEGLAFTVLEPHQARRFRRIGSRTWQDADALDTGRPYRAVLPSGAGLAVFFYHGALSRAVAFEGLLRDGATLAERILAGFDGRGDGTHLVSVATDGESYGHHHRHGDMALAFALRRLEAHPDVALTNYGEHLERDPPRHEVEIAENTSWSCPHGVERWRADCGCADGGHPGWDQSWRAPLRASLDWLRDELAVAYERAGADVLRDPWAARDDYVQVVHDRSDASRRRFLDGHLLTGAPRTSPAPGAEADRADRADVEPDVDADVEADDSRVWKLLESQRHAMLMFTSCGWFFDDLARIETVQVLRYAARAIELGREVLDVDLEEGFVARLAAGRSNDPACGSGADVWKSRVVAAAGDVRKIVAHVAINSLFEPAPRSGAVYAYRVDSGWRWTLEAGDARLAGGRVEVLSTVTRERDRLEYAVVHLGDHNVAAGVRAATTDERLAGTWTAISEPFAAGDLPETLRRLDACFDPPRYSLASLFPDGQRHVLGRVIDDAVVDAVAGHRAIYRSRAALMRYLAEIGQDVPPPFRHAAEVAVNDELRRTFEREHVETARVQALLADAARWRLELDTEGLAHTLTGTIRRLTSQAARDLPEPELFATDHRGRRDFFDQSRALVLLARSLPFEVDLWGAQNLFHRTVREVYPGLEARAGAGDPVAQQWVEQFRALGDALRVAVPHQ